jgi:hypothetical protein
MNKKKQQWRTYPGAQVRSSQVRSARADSIFLGIFNMETIDVPNIKNNRQKWMRRVE